MKRGAWLRLAAAAVVAAVLLAGVADAKKKSGPEVTHTVCVSPHLGASLRAAADATSAGLLRRRDRR
jgi:hypothetical protein